MPVRRPGPQDFVRVHSSAAYRHLMALLKIEDDRDEIYAVDLKGEVGVARRVGRLHGGVAGEHSGDFVFLLAPVHIRDTVSGRWLNQVPQPHTRPKNVVPRGSE